MSVNPTSSSGVGTYGGLKICSHHTAAAVGARWHTQGWEGRLAHLCREGMCLCTPGLVQIRLEYCLCAAWRLPILQTPLPVSLGTQFVQPGHRAPRMSWLSARPPTLSIERPNALAGPPGH